MPDGAIETVTIAEAAALVGVDRNKVRNRIKAGRYKAHKLITAQGETYAIERDSLGLPPPNGAHNASHAQVRHNRSNDAQSVVPADEGHQDQQLAVVQRLLAPFVEDLAETHAELGRVQERLATTERERDHLRAELASLRDAPMARAEAPGATEPAQGHQDQDSSWWARLRRGLVGR